MRATVAIPCAAPRGPGRSRKEGCMTAFKGFFQLQSAADLLQKLESDYRRVEAEPRNPYPAFDFFVTAEHLIDWLYPNDAARRTQLRQSSALLRTCSHVANGSKHFHVTGERHQSVEDGHDRPPARLSELVLGASRLGDATGGLELTLSEREAQELGCAGYIDALDLAARVLGYWRAHPVLQALPAK